MQARQGESGAAMVIVVVALSALIGLSALSIDVGMMWVARTQLQNAADAAALAAAGDMIDLNPDTVNIPNGEAAAISLAGQNKATPTTSVVVNAADIQFGFWDVDSRTLNTAVDLNDPNQVTGVDVTCRLDGGLNPALPAVMSRVLGMNTFNVAASATAYLGYAGSFEPGQIELPVVTDCCSLKGPDCDQPYCGPSGTVHPMPNACPLDDGTNVPGVNCMEFSPTQDQTGCWTVLDNSSPSVNSPDLIDIVNDGNINPVSAGDTMYLDNGDKTPVIQAIADKFYGEGAFLGEAHGSDRYMGDGMTLGMDGTIDSWVTAILVAECQDEDHCAGGDPAVIMGIACVEIREITVTPDKVIRMKYVCPADDLWSECYFGNTTSGGENFGIRATIPLLVR